ncbi:unnamed protein product [Alternaria alternata]
MSNDVAKTLGYSEYDVLAEKKKFTLANGNIVESIGQISSVCSFGTEVETSATMTCVFYILLKAAMPIIMGLEFLEQTKTMTEHRERLVRVPRPVYPGAIRMLGWQAKALVHDLIVGEEVLEELKVFGNYYHALISTSNESKSLELKGIRHLGAVDRIVSKMKNTFGGPRSGSGTDGAIEVNDSSFDALLKEQRENHRRECEAARIENLPTNEQQAARAAEAMKQEAYECCS